MKTCLYTFLLLLLLLTVTASFTPESSNIEEKMYIQTDKTIYRPGEYIFFNAFITDAATGKPSSISEVAYAELYDPKGNMVQQLTLPATNGMAGGEFSLSETMAGGIYTLKGYTRWMTNFGEDRTFVKEIQVQKVITPRLLLKPDFEKKAYGPGDEVTAKLEVADLKNEKAVNASIKVSVRIAGNAYIDFTATTDKEGKALLKFRLPEALTSTDGLLQAVVVYQGVEESVSRAIPIVLNKIDVKFYPEGGQWVSGIPQRMAFEALNKFGKGADVSGEIIDEQGRKVIGFESFHFGMGAFEMTPEPGKRYAARITHPKGNDTLWSLPEAVAQGYVMNLKTQDTSSITWRIFSPIETTAYLVVHVHGISYENKTLFLKQGENTIVCETRKWPAGVAVTTLSDENGRPQCERLVLVNPHKRIHMEIATDKPAYQPGEAVKATITTKDEHGMPVPANLSVAVVDEQLLTMADDKQDNILTYLLLSSELKGKIHEPSFYFNEKEEKSAEAIDYLLLTHGWRRFSWKDKDKTLLPAERRGNNIFGVVLNAKEAPVQAEVILIETDRQKRILKVTTTDKGAFAFLNIDQQARTLVLTKIPNRIRWQSWQEAILKEKETMDKIAVINNQSTPKQVVLLNENVPAQQKATEESSSVQYNSIMAKTLASGVQLDEILVTGYGYKSQAQASLSGVVKTITAHNIFFLDHYLKNNGLSSFILPAVYEKKVSNEVIINDDYTYIPYGIDYEQPQYYCWILPTTDTRIYHFSKDYYQLVPRIIADSNRTDFRTTVYWKNRVITDAGGQASFTYYNNHAVSAFRVTAEGIAHNGMAGRAEHSYSTQLPLSLDVKLPHYMNFSDTLRVPVSVRNNTEHTLQPVINIVIPSDAVKLLTPATVQPAIPAKTSETVLFTLVSHGVKGTFPLSIHLEHPEFKDIVKHDLTVYPVGFPRHYSISGRNSTANGVFTITDMEPGSLQGVALLHISTVEELLAGVESILREPWGCFEQVASATFPNIFALQLMNTIDQNNAETRKRALDFIKKGYAKLAGYESRGGGFEWYGGSPGHEVLTAYGLIQFYEMKRLGMDVDAAMIDRTIAFLQKRRNADGTYKHNNGKYGFSNTPKVVNNAYIAYALAEIERPDGQAYTQALNEALTSKDMYRMALMANAAIKMNRTADYEQLCALFIKEFAGVQTKSLNIQSSIIRGGWTNLTETIALWAVALMRDKSPNWLIIDDCIKFIASKRSPYGYGSTQATALSLRALANYAMFVHGSDAKSTQMTLTVNERSYPFIFDENNRNTITNSEFVNNINITGNNKVNVTFLDTSHLVPYSVIVQWNTLTLENSGKCPLRLSTTLAQTTMKQNETVRLNISLQNTQPVGQPMSMAVIGIPAGLSIQPWQMKELQEKGVFDFYEILDNRLALHYREIAPGETKSIQLDLKADIPGTYTGAASSGYLYYTQEERHWVKGLKIVIK